MADDDANEVDEARTLAESEGRNWFQLTSMDRSEYCAKVRAAKAEVVHPLPGGGPRSGCVCRVCEEARRTGRKVKTQHTPWGSTHVLEEAANPDRFEAWASHRYMNDNTKFGAFATREEAQACIDARLRETAHLDVWTHPWIVDTEQSNAATRTEGSDWGDPKVLGAASVAAWKQKWPTDAEQTAWKDGYETGHVLGALEGAPGLERATTTEEEAWKAYCEIHNTGEGPQGEAQRHAFTFAWLNASRLGDRTEVERRIAESVRVQTRERCAQELYDQARRERSAGRDTRAMHSEGCARRLQGVDGDGNVIALESPPFTPVALAELAARGYERIHAPTRAARPLPDGTSLNDFAPVPVADADARPGMRKGKCPPNATCLACDRLGYHLEPMSPATAGTIPDLSPDAAARLRGLPPQTAWTTDEKQAREWANESGRDVMLIHEGGEFKAFVSPSSPTKRAAPEYAAPTDIPCPTCRAFPLQPCVGLPAETWHPARREQRLVPRQR